MTKKMFIEFIGEFAIMKDLNLDHFSPSIAVIDPKYTLTRTPDPNFSFAFNNNIFFDHLLQI
ncbi:hypothetical protein P3L10_000380 [Capsicum annuum]